MSKSKQCTQCPLKFSQSYTYTSQHKPTGHVEESPFAIDSSDDSIARLPVKLEVTKDQWSEVRPSITWNYKCWWRPHSKDEQGTAWTCISVQWFNSSESCWEIRYPYTIHRNYHRVEMDWMKQVPQILWILWTELKNVNEAPATSIINIIQIVQYEIEELLCFGQGRFCFAMSSTWHIAFSGMSPPRSPAIGIN